MDSRDRSRLCAWFACDVTNPVGPAWVEETAVDITALGGYPILVLFAVLVVAALLIWKRSAAALFVVVSLSGGAVISSGLKLIFLRPRPDVVEHLDRTFTHSFPSAHAMMSMVALLTFAAVASHGAVNRAFRTFAFASAIVISLLIGGSRVYLGVHWPSDVIAGWALGVGWVGTISLVALALRDRVAPSIR